MKFSIDRTALLRSLSHVQNVVEKRNTLPILSNVKLVVKGDALIMTATDMDLEIRESVAAIVMESGETTAPAHMLHDIIRKISDNASIEITLKDSIMTVRAGRSVFKLSCLPVNEFPELGGGEFSHTMNIQAERIRALIDRTRFAMSTEEVRYYLNGIFLHATDSDGTPVLRAVATDGHRLARFEMPLPEGAADMPEIIIPRKTIGELRKILDDAADDVTINISPNKIKFSFDHIVLTSKLIDGKYPEYSRVIPPANDKIIDVDPKIFGGAVDRVATMTEGKIRAIKMTLNGKTLTLAADSMDTGSAVEDLEVLTESPNIEIGFNARYLLDIANNITGNDCRIILSNGATPAIIQDPNDDSTLFVLMPLRV